MFWKIGEFGRTSAGFVTPHALFCHDTNAHKLETKMSKELLAVNATKPPPPKKKTSVCHVHMPITFDSGQGISRHMAIYYNMGMGKVVNGLVPRYPTWEDGVGKKKVRHSVLCGTRQSALPNWLCVT